MYTYMETHGDTTHVSIRRRHGCRATRYDRIRTGYRAHIRTRVNRVVLVSFCLRTSRRTHPSLSMDLISADVTLMNRPFRTDASHLFCASARLASVASLLLLLLLATTSDLLPPASTFIFPFFPCCFPSTFFISCFFTHTDLPFLSLYSVWFLFLPPYIPPFLLLPCTPPPLVFICSTDIAPDFPPTRTLIRALSFAGF